MEGINKIMSHAECSRKHTICRPSGRDMALMSFGFDTELAVDLTESRDDVSVGLTTKSDFSALFLRFLLSGGPAV